MRRLKRAVIGAAVMLLTLPLCSLGEVSAAGGVKLLNLALNKPATESSVYPGSGKDATKAVDGIVSADSRWSTKRLGTGTPAEQWDENVEQWMTVDLGQEYGITQVNINWEAACATKYTLQGSLDGQEFFDVVDGGASQAGEQQLTDFEKFTARYIRVLCREAKTAKYGYSIYELEVYSEDVIDDSYQPTAERILGDKNASQEAVDQAALHVLEELSRMAKTADILSLESMTAAAKELLAGAYTEDSLEALREAIQRAEEVIVDQNRADGDIAEAYEGLVDAVMQLEKKGNKAALAAMIARAEIVLAEQGRYAEATLRGLEEALASAKAVHEQEDALQSAIDDEVRSLTSKLAEARLKGDVNGDGTVTTSDCAALLAASAELTALGNTEAAAADVNGDGTADTTDAALILQYAGERISAF